MSLSVTDARSPPHPGGLGGSSPDHGFSLAPATLLAGTSPAPQPLELPKAPQRPLVSTTQPSPATIEQAFRDTATFLAANRISMGQVFDAAAVELGGTYALEDGVDLSGAFYEFLERPGIAETYPRIEDALAAFGEEELDLSPEMAQRFALDLLATARPPAG